MSRYEGVCDVGEAGEEGESIESCAPLTYHGVEDLTEDYVKNFLGRIVSSSYREPHVLSLYVMRKACILRLLADIKQLLAREATLMDCIVPHSGRVRIFGDLHGDIHSLMEALVLAQLPSEHNYLCFAGDCVDRGCWGVEVLLVLFVLKLWRPFSVFLLRGNHEATSVMCRYGFKAEAERKLGAKLYREIVSVLRELPCAAIVRTLPLSENPASGSSAETPTETTRKGKKRQTRSARSNKAKMLSKESSQAGSSNNSWMSPPQVGERRVLVAHGGLFRSWAPNTRDSLTIGSLEDLARAKRQIDDPMHCIIEDVLWSDPQISSPDVALNKMRGAGILYGSGTVENFFKRNNVHGLIRGHEGPDMREQRPEMNDMLGGHSVDMEFVSAFVATVFSAADYPMDNPRGNKGAFASIEGRGLAPSQIIPSFTQYCKRFQPTDPELFYYSLDGERPATPRQSC